MDGGSGVKIGRRTHRRTHALRRRWDQLVRPHAQSKRARTDNRAGARRVLQQIQITGERQRRRVRRCVVVHTLRKDGDIVGVFDRVVGEDQPIETRILRRTLRRLTGRVVLDKQIVVVEVDDDLVPGLLENRVVRIVRIGNPRDRLRDDRHHLRTQIQFEIDRDVVAVHVQIVARAYEGTPGYVPKRNDVVQLVTDAVDFDPVQIVWQGFGKAYDDLVLSGWIADPNVSRFDQDRVVGELVVEAAAKNPNPI